MGSILSGFRVSGNLGPIQNFRHDTSAQAQRRGAIPRHGAAHLVHREAAVEQGPPLMHSPSGWLVLLQAMVSSRIAGNTTLSGNATSAGSTTSPWMTLKVDGRSQVRGSRK